MSRFQQTFLRLLHNALLIVGYILLFQNIFPFH